LRRGMSAVATTMSVRGTMTSRVSVSPSSTTDRNSIRSLPSITSDSLTRWTMSRSSSSSISPSCAAIGTSRRIGTVTVTAATSSRDRRTSVAAGWSRPSVRGLSRTRSSATTAHTSVDTRRTTHQVGSREATTSVRHVLATISPMIRTNAAEEAVRAGSSASAWTRTAPGRRSATRSPTAARVTRRTATSPALRAAASRIPTAARTSSRPTGAEIIGRRGR